MSKLIIMVGNIGCGKSFLASKLAKKGSVVVNMDTIQQSLAGGEYGLYDFHKKKVYHAVELTAIETALDQGFDVVVDRTNIGKKIREKYIALGKKYTDKIICYDYGPGEHFELERRLDSARGVPNYQWLEVFETMRKRYEEPTSAEGFSNIYVPPKQFTFHAFDFDGTIVEHKFPKIGNPIPKIVTKIESLWSDLDNVIIIWTCRSKDYENQARKFLLANKIPFDFINENPLFDMGSRKIFAHVYYGDRNEGGIKC